MAGLSSALWVTPRSLPAHLRLPVRLRGRSAQDPLPLWSLELQEVDELTGKKGLGAATPTSETSLSPPGLQEVPGAAGH